MLRIVSNWRVKNLDVFCSSITLLNKIWSDLESIPAGANDMQRSISNLARMEDANFPLIGEGVFLSFKIWDAQTAYQFCSDAALLSRFLVTFRVSRRRREMYCGHTRLCVCVSVSLSAAPCVHYCTDPDVTWENGRGCPLVVQYWADLLSVHVFCCYDNSPNAKCQRVSDCLYSLYVWFI